jgi:hypothetical protein
MFNSLVGPHIPGRAFIARVAVACICFAAMVADAHAQEEPSPDRPPPFALLRYDEDYSYLRDPSARTGDLLSLEPIKFIPLNPTGDWYLSMGGEVRGKYEFYNNPNFGLSPQDEGGELLQRYLLHGDLHLGPSFRMFGQLRGAYAAFRDGPLVPVNEDGFDIQQAFFDLRSGPWGDGPKAVTLRVGRQEMSYGSERLISVREATNVRRAFDAVRVLTELRTWRVDGFFARPVENTPHAFDTWAGASTQFWGVYATGPVGRVPGMKVDLYYLGLDRSDATFDQGTADELRHTVGVRLFGEAGAFDYNVEGMYQWGRFGSGDIRAWALGSNTGYTFKAVPLTPRIELRADVISGDHDPGGADLGTFNPLFPRGNYFGESATIGPVNLLDVHPIVQLNLSEAVSLELGWAFFWRYSTGDGVYSNALNLIQAAGGSDRRYVGSELSVVLDWRLNRYVSLRTSYAHLFAGSFLKDTGPGKDVDFVAVLATYRF